MDKNSRVMGRQGQQSLSFLYQQLMSAKIEEEEDLMNGFNNIKSTVSKIKTLGETVSDFLLAQIIMNALPSSYAIVSTIIQTPATRRYVGYCLKGPAEEEHRRKGGGITAMFAQLSKSKPMQKKSSGNNSKGRRRTKDLPVEIVGKLGIPSKSVGQKEVELKGQALSKSE
ncbi:hypothetical protein OPQ81_005396 [Rhizoctonia solani]|nr:hypothetical protein OPQ81_005396 [Rhizoctonia solani]